MLAVSISSFLLLLSLQVLFVSVASADAMTRAASQAMPRSSMKTPRRQLHTDSCRTGNPIDDCWRCDPDWEANRIMLADCSIGFGRKAIGGRDGELYVVTDPDNDDPLNPIPGTLRYAVIQEQPLWIIFDHDMIIQLKQVLVMNSDKTIDGRGSNVHIANGPCIAIENVTNIIIHGIYIYNCIPGSNGWIRDSADHYGWRTYSDGDGISIYASREVWIDHCSFSNCHDGLIDAIYGSTAITISNNYMEHHNEVMLMGHSDDFTADQSMQVTIAFNYFGEGLVQRMPRCRHGYFHIVNNLYSGWEMYAIGGSANPTINSQGNVFVALDSDSSKEVTKRESVSEDEWKNWNWRTDGDLMINGAFFTASGQEAPASYIKASSMAARSSSLTITLNMTAGALNCKIGFIC